MKRFLYIWIVALTLLLFSHLSVNAQSVVYHYWFDNNTESVTTTSDISGGIDCSGLQYGLHCLNMFIEQDGDVSSVKSSWFMRDIICKNNKLNLMVLIDGKQYTTVEAKASGTTPIELDLLTIEEGPHTVSVTPITSEYVSPNICTAEFVSSCGTQTGTLALTVVDASGNDVTDKTTITWYNNKGDKLAIGSRISGLTVGDTLAYKITVSDELGYHYKDIGRTKACSEIGEKTITESLTAYTSINVSGYAHSNDRVATGLTVLARQYLNDRYITQKSVVTDSNGEFNLELVDAPTRFEFSGDGFVNGAKVVEDLTAEGNLPVDLEVERVGRKQIALNIDYQKSSPTGPVSSIFTDISEGDVIYTIISESDGSELGAGVFNGKNIFLPEGINAGTPFRVTLESKSQLFDPVSGTEIVANDDVTNLAIILKEKGIIECENTDANSLVDARAYLYDSHGRLITSSHYSEGKVSFKGLSDGQYSVVSLVNDGAMGALASLSDYELLGLNANSDYKIDVISVVKGYVANVTASAIPAPDISMATTLTSAAMFYASKTSVTADEMITGTIMLNLDDEVVSKATGGKITLSFPFNCIYEEGSMMINGHVIPVSNENNNVTFEISQADLNSRIRFCLRSAAGGDYNVGATLTLSMGSNVNCPIGKMYYHTSDFSMSVPAKTAKKQLIIAGTSGAFSNVEILDGDVVVGHAVADGLGYWEKEIELHNAYNLSNHLLWMRATNKDGFVFSSKAKACSYHESYVTPVSVTMLNTAHPAGNLTPMEVKSVFYLENGHKHNKSYLYWPEYPEFTFLIDFTRNDPDAVSNVLLTVFTENDRVITLPAEFDTSKGCWVTSYEFPENDLPTNVDVEYVMEAPVDENTTLSNEYIEELANIEKDKHEVNLLLEEAEKALTKNDEDEFMRITAQIDRKLRIENNNDEPDKNVLALIDELDEAKDSTEFMNIFVRFEQSYPPITPPGNLDDDFWTFELSNNTIDTHILNTPGISFIPGKNEDDSSFNENNFDYGSLYISNTDDILNDNTKNIILKDKNGNTIIIDSHPVIRAIPELSDKINKPTCIETSQYIEGIIDAAGGIGGTIWGTVNNMLDAVGDYYENRVNRSKAIKDGWCDIWRKLNSNPNARPDDISYVRNQRIKAYRQFNDEYVNCKKTHAKIYGYAGKVMGFVGATVNIHETIQKVSSSWDRWKGVKSMIEDICISPAREILLQEANRYELANRGSSLGFAASSVSTEVLQVVGIGGSVETLGTSLLLAGAGMIAGELLNRAHARAELIFENLRTEFIKQVLATPNCKKKPHDEDYDPPYPRPNIDPIRDPSGIVYEGVMSMPIEGVKATIYQSNSANVSDKGQVWDAEVYGQINPLFTDSQGMYAWDVPRGNFKVVFEKEGYETTSTDWLPVPPPQLDVNISMRKTNPATLKSANAYMSEVAVEFDTYMDAATLTSDNIYLENGGQRIDAVIKLDNSEKGTSENILASKLHIIPASPLSGTDVTLIIKKGTTSYAGVGLSEDIRCILPIQLKITNLVAPEVFNVGYSENKALRILAIPAKAVAGKTLSAVSSSSQIVSVDETSVEFDEDGYATISINGLLPGNTALTFKVEGYDSLVTTRVVVGAASTSDVAVPEASIPSGTVVESGTTVRLYCPTPDAVIYYTLDGSCPCDPNAKRKVYDASHPIVISKSTDIRAMAVKDDMVSEIVTFSYIVEASSVDEILVEKDVKIYPVPIKDILYIDVSGYDKFDITLTNAAGLNIMKQSLYGSHAAVDVSSLPSGVYLLKLNLRDTDKTFKVIKQ